MIIQLLGDFARRQGALSGAGERRHGARGAVPEACPRRLYGDPDTAEVLDEAGYLRGFARAVDP